MPRPTRGSLEKSLLNGEAVKYKDGAKTASVQLTSTQSRRLFKFLLTSEVRDAKDLPKSFIEGLWQAYASDAALPTTATESAALARDGSARTWRIERLTTKNFGGLNIYDGPDFVWELKGESWLLDGENASGKSSLLGAIAWAFTGNRPRDEAPAAAHVDADVHDEDDKRIGSWPPLACYPNEARGFGQAPEVEVTVDLISDDGKTAVVQRILRSGKIQSHSTAPIDDIFISTSVEMPLVLPTLRLKDKAGEGALARAVSQLTGLEELVSIGELADGLSHGAREYSSYSKRSGLQAKLSDFDARINEAREELKQIGHQLPNFSPKDAAPADSPMALKAIEIQESAASLAGSLIADLAAGTDTSKLETQREIIVALSSATAVVSQALSGTSEWETLESIEQALSGETTQRILSGLSAAERQVREALDVDARQRVDSRSRLKAMASAWHAEHRAGPIELCPLCDQDLQAAQGFKDELESLSAAGLAATLTLQQNLLAIREGLLQALPPTVVAALRSDVPSPRQWLIDAVRHEIGTSAKFGHLLKRLSELVEDALLSAPPLDCMLSPLPPQEFASKDHEVLVLTLHRIRNVLELAAWFRTHRDAWTAWWAQVAVDPLAEKHDTTTKKETIREHLKRLTEAMDGAKPYARAAAALNEALSLAKTIREIQLEQERRDQVIAALQPLKQLPSLAQSVARQAIEDLSDRIGAILDGMHTTERFRYRASSLKKREGLIVRGSFESDLRIDATLIANTSWLRSTLWAFIFALRQEAVEQRGLDEFPVWLFDDPQTTFDMAHRLNWSSHVAGFQSATPSAQVIIATHDETFAAKLRQSDLHARGAIIKAATADSGPLEVLEGSRVERRWEEANADRSSKAKAVAYLSETRTYLEGLLKAMLAGQGADIRTKSVSDLRDRMIELGRQGFAPWDKKNFKDLARALNIPALKYLHQSHHSDRDQLTFSEAKEVASIWPNVSRLLTQCFRDIRDYRLLHGMPSAFHLAPSLLDFPEGFGAVVAQHPLPLLGRASAFSGRISEGTLNYQAYDPADERNVRLGQHCAYRLAARTLEPVARAGDILLVHEALDPTYRSLVVAIAEDRVVARRYVISEASSDVAVLTANALDPFEIAPPIVARRETIKARRVVGVLFDRASLSNGLQEVEACRAESEVQSLLSRCRGLVEVAGQSAQPLALDGQYLLVGDRVADAAHLRRLDGMPVIARDSDSAHYFKRLRLSGDGLVILESLDGGGEYPPEVLWAAGGHGRTLEDAWEVLGVLFERP